MNEDIYNEWIAKAAATRKVARFTITAPWAGFTPDLPPNLASASGFQAMYGLMARPDPQGNGEVLMVDAGNSPVDGGNLPLVTTIGSHTNVTMLAQFNRTTTAGAKTTGTEYGGPTMLALVGGDNITTKAAELWRVKPSDGTWEKVPYNVADADAAQSATVGREYLSDWAEFPAGAPDRDADSGNITEPVFVWCNLIDRVMIYPTPDANAVGGALLIENGTYEPLTDRFSDDFRAATVEHFGGRLYFGNTIEAGVQHRQRIRRTALFTADPKETIPGAGAFDIRDFSGDLLRLEKLADLLVAYFEDGVAFIRTTDIATAPDRVQLLREKRGLLSTHSVVSVGNQEHFGVFDDGWFFLDPSGRWTEVGILVGEDGIQIPKWKETFYQLLDKNNKHRTVVNYDGRYVRIAFTAIEAEAADNLQVWIFDPRGNRVFPDLYLQPVLCWGEANAQIRAATRWDELQGIWKMYTGSWNDWGAEFGVKNLNHGTTTGHVLVHDYNSYTRYDTVKGLDYNPAFLLRSMLTSGGDPTRLKTALKLWAEYIESATSSVGMTVGGDSAEGKQSRSVDWTQDGATVGDINRAFANFTHTSVNLYYELTGNSPIRIRSVLLDVAAGVSEERTG
jgi:hypothetical protein